MTALGLDARKRMTAGVLVALAVGMVGLAYASVPLYRLFCQVTGFGGTTQEAQQPSAVVLDRTVVVRFNADVARGMPWRFTPARRSVEVKLGQTTQATYIAENPTARPITGTATFNVTPEKVGRYFIKIDCFCFEEQRLEPGQRVELPVVFYVDPALADDAAAREVGTITLSYTFFEATLDATGGN
ncbi:MAG: cytochrome c oxidase assembly protein [Arenimonas sp.]